MITVTESGISVSTEITQRIHQQDRITVYPAPKNLDSGAVVNLPPRTFVLAQMSTEDQTAIAEQTAFWERKYSDAYGTNQAPVTSIPAR